MEDWIFYGVNEKVEVDMDAIGKMILEAYEFERRKRNPNTTLSGTPKPQLIPYRLENIEEAQIETDGR